MSLVQELLCRHRRGCYLIQLLALTVILATPQSEAHQNGGVNVTVPGCYSCPEGYYNDIDKGCQPCTKCVGGLVAASPCGSGDPEYCDIVGQLDTVCCEEYEYEYSGECILDCRYCEVSGKCKEGLIECDCPPNRYGTLCEFIVPTTQTSTPPPPPTTPETMHTAENNTVPGCYSCPEGYYNHLDRGCQPCTQCVGGLVPVLECGSGDPEYCDIVGQLDTVCCEEYEYEAYGECFLDCRRCEVSGKCKEGLTECDCPPNRFGTLCEFIEPNNQTSTPPSPPTTPETMHTAENNTVPGCYSCPEGYYNHIDRGCQPCTQCVGGLVPVLECGSGDPEYCDIVGQLDTVCCEEYKYEAYGECFLDCRRCEVTGRCKDGLLECDCPPDRYGNLCQFIAPSSNTTAF